MKFRLTPKHFIVWTVVMVSSYVASIVLANKPAMRLYPLILMAAVTWAMLLGMILSWRQEGKDIKAGHQAEKEQWEREYLFIQKMTNSPLPKAEDRPTVLISLDELMNQDEINIEQLRD